MPKRLQLTLGDHAWMAEVSADRVALHPGEGTLVVSRADQRLQVTGGAEAVTGSAAVTGDVVWVSVRGEVFAITVTHGARRAASVTRDHDAFTPPMSATVVRIAVKPGDAVKDGDVVIALEAMKMELAIRSPRDGVVRAINCREGELVQPGDILLALD
jgi:biotin carboxyl carrier protein